MNNAQISRLQSLIADLTGQRMDLATVATAIFLVLVARTLIGQTTRSQFRKHYESMIARAKRERDNKRHGVLETKDAQDDESKLDWTGSDIRTAVLENKLDLPAHVASLAWRCRTYGRQEDGVNAIAEELYDDAYAAAVKYKKYVTESKSVTKSNAPPLFGVPISIKESLSVRGTYSTGGLACNLSQRAPQDSLAVSVLRDAGAIPLCTGNVSQLLMLPESFNNIWGLTRNPHNFTRSVGGSSGGDAALVAIGCVPIAVGTDVAGSIRIPACCNGIVGFKPSAARSSTIGTCRARKENRVYTGISNPGVIGSLARCVDDAALFFKAFWVPQLFQGDPNVAPMTFNDKTYEANEKLTIGYFDSDSWFEPCQTSKRAVRETIEKLTKAGHKCVPFALPRDGWFNYRLMLASNASEGGFKSFLDALDGEQPVDIYNPMIMMLTMPDVFRWFLKTFIAGKRQTHLLNMIRRKGLMAWELGELMADLQELRQEWALAFSHSGVDAVVFPALPIPAFRHFTSGQLSSSVSYIFLANLLMWPSGTVPVTTVREDEVLYPVEDLPEDQRDAIAQMVEANIEGSAGMPISVSVMTPAYRDEECLRVMKEVEKVVQFNVKPQAFKNHF